MDVESLQRNSRRRGSCLDVFLVMSIIFLFVAVAALAVGGAVVVTGLQSKVQSPRPPFQSLTSELTGDAQGYKIQNFVYLEASSSNLETSTMPWASVHYAAGTSVGSNFLFDAEKNSVTPKRPGTYFMYIDLNFTCTYTCNTALLSVHVGDKLTCEVALPAASTPVSKRCWTVSHLDEQSLLTQMTVPKGRLQDWKLELKGSGFGMFLVD